MIVDHSFPDDFLAEDDANSILKNWFVFAEYTGFALISKQFKIQWVNNYALSLIKLTLADVAGKDIRTFFTGKYRKIVDKMFREADEKGASRSYFTKAIPRGEGMLRRIAATKKGYVMAAVDISLIKQAQKRKEDIKTTLRVLADTKDQLLSDAKLSVLDSMRVHCEARCTHHGNRETEKCYSRSMVRKEIESGKPLLDVALTDAELRVARLTQKGLKRAEIAKQLHISDHTVKNHRTSIRRKLNLKGCKTNLSKYLQRFII